MKKGTIFIIGNNPELSESIQKALFALGYSWNHRKTVKILEDEAIWANSVDMSLCEGPIDYLKSAYLNNPDKRDCEIVNLSGYRRFISMEEREPVEGDVSKKGKVLHVCKDGRICNANFTCTDKGDTNETLAFLPLSNPPDPELLKIGLPKKQAKVDVQLTANGKEVSVDEMMELLKEMKGDK